MNKIYFCPVFILFFLLSISCSAQVLSKELSHTHNGQNEIQGDYVHTENRNTLVLESNAVVHTGSEDAHAHCAHYANLFSETSGSLSGIMSLDEIISSDDLTDFRCTGGFCMNESHSHKKGLSFQKQLFNYFMKVSI